MKPTISFLLMMLSLSLISSAQTGSVKWRVSFNYTESVNSSSKSATKESTHSLKINGSVTMLIAGEPAFDKGHVILMTPQDTVLSFSAFGNVSDRSTSKTKDPLIGVLETREDQYEGKADQSEQGVEFEYDPATDGAKYINAGIRFNKKGNYKINVFHRGAGIPDQHLEYESNDDFGAYLASAEAEGDAIKVVKKGFVIDVHKTEQDNKPGPNGETNTSTRTIDYQVTIFPASDLIAVIEPVTSFDIYHKWLPEGPDLKKPGSFGNNIKFRIYLKDKKKPNEKIITGIDQVNYYFDEVSSVPGYAMNYPAKDISTKADLQLGKIDDLPDTGKEVKQITITTKDDPTYLVKVESFDYGSFGKLKASVTLSTGEVLEATEINSKKYFITIPYCSKENSVIADSWKEDEKAMDMEDTDDNEDQDKLANIYKGDGYSLYEEYRGFIEDGKHIRTSALKKDVMICDKIKEKLEQAAAKLPANDIRKKSLGGRSQDGINMFADITGFVAHSNFKEEEFGIDIGHNVYQGNKDLEGLQLPHFTSSKIMNFNNWDTKNLHEQSGILILPSALAQGFAASYGKNSNPVRPPSQWYCLVITADFDPSPNGYSSTTGDITKDGTGVVVNPGGKAKIITDEYAATVAHEILHYCNVRHHGTKNEEDDTYSFFSGKNIPNGDPEKVYLKINNKLSGAIDFRLDDEAGTPIKGTDNMFQHYPDGRTFSFAAQQGTCSGVEDCIMRYDLGRVFLKGNTYYLTLESLDFHNGETTHRYANITGIGLCDSPVGTGVNAKDHKPRNRYGDADAGRGNCKAQVCINDKYK